MDEPLSIREAARFTLVRRSVDDDETLSRAFLNALKLSAETLNVARVGIWRYEDDGARIRCEMLFDRRTGNAAPGEVIDLLRCPRYAEALRTRRVVMAEDAREDSRTGELTPYLVANDIHALLDCPVFEQGDAIGVVCHEHVGAVRAWTAEDRYFAATVADMLGLYLEQRASARHYQELLDARRELERHRVMESLGRMAANVAHDFNNVLLALQLRTDFMRKDPPQEDRGHVGADLLSIVDQGRRLVRNLLDFANQDQPPTTVIDLANVLRAMRPALSALADDGIDLTMELPDEPVYVRLEQSGAEQIVMNLVKNARDALIGGGHLRLTLTLDVGPNGDDPARPLARLVVADTGVGMDDATREKAFEPFFTTKERGEGDGLGLSTVYSVVTAAGGTVSATSALGEGTTITVLLPRLGGAST
ncbi:MAG: GAF domain-containing sensor histidine kinase [Sandaracinaceae bacterium]|nr:GAF domain-containing sensor histidine kinase [Sandaracinaceae bacterium]